MLVEVTALGQRDLVELVGRIADPEGRQQIERAFVNAPDIAFGQRLERAAGETGAHRLSRAPFLSLGDPRRAAAAAPARSRPTTA